MIIYRGEYSFNEYESSASEPQAAVAAAPEQGPREGKAYNTAQSYQPGQSQQFNQQRPGQQAPAQEQYAQQQSQGQPEEPEPTVS